MPGNGALPSSDGSTDAAIPAMPVILPDGIWFDSPFTLVDGDRYTIGWQRWTTSKGGPRFLVLRRNAFGTLKPVQRYPLTEEGWAQAWRTLLMLEPSTAHDAREALRATRELRRLEANSLAYLTEVTFLGGYAAEMDLAADEVYDLRFLGETFAIFKVRGTDPIVALRYEQLQEVEVGGPGLVRNWSPSEQAMMVRASGATVALLAHGAHTKIKTVIRVQAPGSELFFLDATSEPDDVRIQLSPALNVLRHIQAARQEQPRASLADELSRLAALVDRGILTREEFDRLKAKLIGLR